MRNHIGTALRRSAAVLSLAAAAAFAGCGGEDDASICKGCRINGEFYKSCPSYPQAYCAEGQPCNILIDMCE